MGGAGGAGAGSYGGNVVIAPQQNHHQQQPQPTQAHMYQHGGIHGSQAPSQPQAAQQQQQQQQQQAPQEQYQKKRTAIKLVDPNTGKDMTSEVFTKKRPEVKKAPPVNSEESIKQKTAALFAAQVAKKIAGSTPPPAEKSATATPPATTDESDKNNEPTPSEESKNEQTAPPPKKSEKVIVTAPPLAPTLKAAASEAGPPAKDMEVVKSEADATVVGEEKGAPLMPPIAMVDTTNVVATVEFVKDDVVEEVVETAKQQQPTENVEPKTKPVETNAATAVDVTPTVESTTPAASINQTVENIVTDDEEALKCVGAGSRVEGIKTVDGKIRPISKVEGSVITNEVKLVAELAEKVGQLEVTAASSTSTTTVNDEEEVKVKETDDETSDLISTPPHLIPLLLKR